MMYSCIRSIRCPENLWLFDINDRAEYRSQKTIDYYYHEFHVDLPDKHSQKKSLEFADELSYFEDEIQYVVKQKPMVEFLNFYVPWSSMAGAVMVVSSFLITLCTGSKYII